jgi:hypothetical protein
MPFAPAETVPLDTVFRFVCYPHQGLPIEPEHCLGHSRKLYNAQFHVWCAGRDGTLTIRDARDAEMGTGTWLRAQSNPASKLDVVHTMAFPQSFARSICVVAKRNRPLAGDVWVGYSNGIVRVFEQRPPFKLIAELCYVTNKAPCNALAADQCYSSFYGRHVVGAFGDDHLVVFSADSKAILHKMLGHTGAVTSVAFVGNSLAFASGSDDGCWALWDPIISADTPVALNASGRASKVTALLVLGIARAQADAIRAARASHLPPSEDFEHVGEEAEWVVLWVAYQSGTLNAYLLPTPAHHDSVASVNIGAFLLQPVYHTTRPSHSIVALAEGPPTAAGHPTVMGTTAGSTKAIRYDSVAFSSLPALTASLTDAHIGVGAGSYAPATVSTATMMPVWSLDRDGRLTPIILERAGANGSLVEQYNLAEAYRLRLEAAAARGLRDLADHSQLLCNVLHPAEDPELQVAVAKSRELRTQRELMRNKSVGIIGRESGLGVLGKYFRAWTVMLAHRRHTHLRNRSSAALQKLQQFQLRMGIHKWQFGASILKVARVKREAAQRLRRIMLRRLTERAYRKWFAYRAQSGAQRKLQHIFQNTSSKIRRRCFDALAEYARTSRVYKAKTTALRILARQGATTLRHIYFSKWQHYCASLSTKASVRRSASQFMTTLARSSKRGLVAAYYRKWKRYGRVVAANRARLNAAQFLVAGSSTLLRKKTFSRWMAWSRRRASRRSTSSADSALMRLTQTGMRRAYFSKWKAVLTMRRATEARTASADGAMWFVASRSRKTMMAHYYGKWQRFAGTKASDRRHAHVLEAFLRQTRLGLLLSGFRSWRQWLHERKNVSRRVRTAGLLARSSTSGLRGQYFHAWRRFPRIRRAEQRRHGVLSVFQRSASSSLRSIYFRRWRAVASLSAHLHFAAKAMKENDGQRTRALRHVYYGKWMGLLLSRRVLRRRAARLRHHQAAAHVAGARGEVQRLNERIRNGKEDMNSMLTDEVRLLASADALNTQAHELVTERDRLAQRAEVADAKLTDVSTTVRHYAYTLTTPHTPSPVFIAAAWKDAWLAMESRIRALDKRTDDCALSFPEYYNALADLRTQALHLRTKISIDVAEHLAIKKDPAPEAILSSIARSRGSSPSRSFVTTPGRRPPSPVSSRALTPRTATPRNAAKAVDSARLG